ncbi:hypothetical protein CGLO_18188 [Colletotrichum gloeosporioides Cg-14]|uniref:Uncharacterized protein n=1 Tax=Colletotrichum gloeosporioides (strain Cg-14) TaxID=1237896 RepID=T0KV49_COLGC|nr:hypothetical protein CGLO_18188 [Colletotrichum gloeosporioides Cg-14]
MTYTIVLLFLSYNIRSPL